MGLHDIPLPADVPLSSSRRISSSSVSFCLRNAGSAQRGGHETANSSTGRPSPVAACFSPALLQRSHGRTTAATPEVGVRCADAIEDHSNRSAAEYSSTNTIRRTDVGANCRRIYEHSGYCSVRCPAAFLSVQLNRRIPLHIHAYWRI